ncbi:hypothetical protein [Methanobrevibacter sp.]|uniref:hypothetical protein n=1 Tax=Methanobrevibacter sp. TaxID=66852 RepID=UPI0025FC5D22|nr:hypothetical protein [Methanobrevibacter sp.]MBQ6511697.1 hypothetical protein [Methanobrevibacter sp.]
MKDDIEEFIEDMFKIKHHDRYEFKTLCGFTFVFKRTTFEVNEKVASEEISPAGIIYEENDEIYLAPLDETIKIEAIVKEFVDKCLE